MPNFVGLDQTFVSGEFKLTDSHANRLMLAGQDQGETTSVPGSVQRSLAGPAVHAVRAADANRHASAIPNAAYLKAIQGSCTKDHGVRLHSPHVGRLQIAHKHTPPHLHLCLWDELDQPADYLPGRILPNFYFLNIQAVGLLVLPGLLDEPHSQINPAATAPYVCKPESGS